MLRMRIRRTELAMTQTVHLLGNSCVPNRAARPDMTEVTLPRGG